MWVLLGNGVLICDIIIDIFLFISFMQNKRKQYYFFSCINLWRPPSPTKALPKHSNATQSD